MVTFLGLLVFDGQKGIQNQMTRWNIDIVRSIEHTLLKAEAKPSQIDTLCAEAIDYDFAGVCVNPVYVRRASARLADHAHIKVISVVGFPLGANLTVVKTDEARRALDDGATEIDLVPPIGKLIAGDVEGFRDEIAGIAAMVHHQSADRILKVILETTLLTRHQVAVACNLCREGLADFVKTSTGFHPTGGARVDDVRFLREHASPLLVKAAGGIRTAGEAVAMLRAGAARIGTSSSVAIAKELYELQVHGAVDD